MNEQIKQYLLENKESFSKEILTEELRKVGHVEGEIQECIKVVYGSINGGFWSFKSKKNICEYF